MHKKYRIIVELHNGQEVDICTRSGAHAFIRDSYPQEKQQEVTYLTADSSNGAHAFTKETEKFNFFASSIEVTNRIRQKAKENNPGKLTTQEEEQLVVTYVMAYALAENSDPEIFNKIPESEIECWMDHVMEQITEKTKDDRCVYTGILSEQRDMFLLLNPCVSMFMHSVPTRLAFEKDFFRVLANFIASRKASSLACTEIARNVVMLMSTVICTVICTVSSNQKILLTVEKAFETFESSGILVQYIRCSTTQGNIGVLEFYDELIKCPAHSDDCIILLVVVFVIAFWCL
jgi:hypothetical protein